jgi:hypothetical protein
MIFENKKNLQNLDKLYLESRHKQACFGDITIMYVYCGVQDLTTGKQLCLFDYSTIIVILSYLVICSLC